MIPSLPSFYSSQHYPSTFTTNPTSSHPRRPPPSFPAQSFNPSTANSHPALPSQSIHKTSTSAFPSPLPLLPLAPPQVASLRGHLHRRRSSYPPATTPGSSAGFTWVLGGTPSAKQTDTGADLFDPTFSSFGSEVAHDTVDWTGLLEFDHTPNKLPHNPATSRIEPPVLRAKSEPREKNDSGMNPSRIAQFGSDLAWKTILASVVEVEGVGEVGVCRVLQEVWKRGGGETVRHSDVQD